MIYYASGNIVNTTCESFINTINCVGVMGKGIALETRKKYPEIMYEYKIACRNGKLRPGGILVLNGYDGKQIINLATKDHWKHNSRYEWIELGLENLKKFLEGPIAKKSIGIPRIGCGLGGLSWGKVKPMIIDKLGNIDKEICLYE